MPFHAAQHFSVKELMNSLPMSELLEIKHVSLTGLHPVLWIRIRMFFTLPYKQKKFKSKKNLDLKKKYYLASL
jgi:hypothetical protein